MPLNWLFGSERSIDQQIERWMEKNNVPGLAACIVHQDGIVWSNGYGLANRTKNIPFTPDSTLFQIASITKTITATAIMQLRDRGLFALDDDVNAFLPFSLRNPRHPGRPISVRHLLTHTSSIDDDDCIYGLYTAGDPVKSLEDVVTAYFTPGGALWRPSNFRKDAPGEKNSYSNAGFALLGYLVERIMEQPLEDYLQENIFRPLKMYETSFYIAKLDEERQARCYTHARRPKRYLCSGDGDGNLLPAGVSPQAGFNEHALYSYPTLADGMLRTSVNQLANFMIAMMNGGRFEDAQLLSPETVREMLSGRKQGLAWSREDAYWGHDGGDPGCSTQLLFDPVERIGFIVFANTDAELEDVMDVLEDEVEERLR
jgi:CubicO group peptidase (beta-lactamase class C family)